MTARILLLTITSFAVGFLVCSIGDYYRWTIRVAEFYSVRPNYIDDRNEYEVRAAAKKFNLLCPAPTPKDQE